MPESSSDPMSSAEKSVKRSLPQWMSAKESSAKTNKKQQVDTSKESTKKSSNKTSKREDAESLQEPRKQSNSNLYRGKDIRSSEGPNKQTNESSSASLEDAQEGVGMSKILDGVVFALSGFVNPERGTLRSQGLEMGAEYRADWTSDCTLLVCAFSNTPKFQQVQSENGTIVSKGWIAECHKQKKLVPVEPYLMHAGKPWRKIREQVSSVEAQRSKSFTDSKKQSDESQVNMAQSFTTVKSIFSPSTVKEWALNDLRETISWLEDQEEKPEATQMKAIAAEGIMTCLQDVIESLKQGKEAKSVTDQWMFVPRVVKEFTKLDAIERRGSLSKKKLYEQAIKCMEIYKDEFNRLDNLSVEDKKPVHDSNWDGGSSTKIISRDDEYDSDDTIEMNEEEIELACKRIPELCR